MHVNDERYVWACAYRYMYVYGFDRSLGVAKDEPVN